MDIHSTFETLAEAWVAASTPTAVNPEPKVSLRLVEVVRICVWRVSWKRKTRLHQCDAGQISNFVFLLRARYLTDNDRAVGIVSLAQDESWSSVFCGTFCFFHRPFLSRVWVCKNGDGGCALCRVAATGVSSTGNPGLLSGLTVKGTALHFCLHWSCPDWCGRVAFVALFHGPTNRPRWLVYTGW